MTDLRDALVQSLARQRAEAEQFGVGIAWGEDFVQWVRDAAGSVVRVEVRTSAAPEAVAGPLAQHGLVPLEDRRLARHGIAVFVLPAQPARGATDDEALRLLAGVVTAAGGGGAAQYEAFPPPS